MSWKNCKRSIFVPRATFTSALFKVLLTLKMLHGNRQGMRGSTLEDIAMHMIKHFCLDGDIKSQVLASLKYGVKMHFIQKRKDKFSLILPASSIHLAPCKFKNEEIERILSVYPPAWISNCGNPNSCAMFEGDQPCCGVNRRNRKGKICCDPDNVQEDDEEEDGGDDSCNVCRVKKAVSKDTCDVCNLKKSARRSDPCEVCSTKKKPKKRKHPPCPRTLPSACSRMKKQKRKKGECESNDPFDNYCLLCDQPSEADEEGYPYDAPINCKCCKK